MSRDPFGDLRRARFLTLRVLRAIERLADGEKNPGKAPLAAALGSLLHRIAVVHEFPEERRLLRVWPGHSLLLGSLDQDHEATRHLAVALCTVPDGSLGDPRTRRLVHRAARALLQVDDLLDELEGSWGALSEDEQRGFLPFEDLEGEKLSGWSEEVEALEQATAQVGASSLSISRSRR